MVKKALLFFLYSNLLISFSSIGLILVTYQILEIPFSLKDVFLLTAVFSSVFLVYNVFIFFDEKQFVHNKYKADWLIKNNKALLKLSYAIIILLGLSLSFLTIKDYLFALHIALISLLYVLPQSLTGKNLNLRRYSFLKIILLTYVWTACTVFLPVIHNDLKISVENLVFLFLERAIMIFSLALPFDIRDIEMDKREGLLTIPIAMGVERTKLLSIISLFVFVLISYFHYGNGSVLASRLIASVVASNAILNIKKEVEDSYYLLCIDGIMILQFLLLSVFTL